MRRRRLLAAGLVGVTGLFGVYSLVQAQERARETAVTPLPPVTNGDGEMLATTLAASTHDQSNGCPIALPSGDESSTNASLATSATSTSADVVVLSGAHTVNHSTAPLPSAASPRPDGKPTLVWFSATWCEYCHQMEPVVGQAKPKLDGKLVLVEKAYDVEPDLFQQYHVLGTPTFVLLSAQGKELTRFNVESDPNAFVSRVLNAAGA